MPYSEIDNIIERLLADSACNLSPATRVVAMPDSLPADVRHFFTRCAGGRFYHQPDHRSPQFGCELRHPGEQPVAQLLPCDGPVFDWLYIVCDFDTGEHEHAVVSAHPDTHGHIYRLCYSPGDPN